jgi:CubicO group peptidase (beta-lactamase class C family)
MKKITLILSILTLLLAGCNQAPIAQASKTPDYWPTDGWKNSTPAAQGMDSTLLAQMLEEISASDTNIYSVLVVRNGYMVTEAYFQPYEHDTNVHVQSVTKSIIGMLTGIAISQGAIKSADETLDSFFPGRIPVDNNKDRESIRISHLLSMTSGLDCQEFSGTGQTMEQTSSWVQFMLNRPMASKPGKKFGYCNGNAHLLSAIIEKTTGINTRIYANQELFQPLGIVPVEKADWETDPKGYTMGGYGLHLRPVDLAKLAYLYLQNGKWEDQQIIPDSWVEESTTQKIKKEDGSGYGYLWTVYPKQGHYAALGLGGQQIHVYPARNLIVVVTAGVPSYAEAPEIENMLNKFILPSIQSEDALGENPDGVTRLENAVQFAAKPVLSVPELPEIANDISGKVYLLDQNPVAWSSIQVIFPNNSATAQLILNESEALDIGLDHLYRLSQSAMLGEILLRGEWDDPQTFVVDYPYSLYGKPRLGELGETMIRFKFTENTVDIEIVPLIFGGDKILIHGKS